MKLLFSIIFVNFVLCSSSSGCGNLSEDVLDPTNDGESKRGQWPWLVSLHEHSNSNFICGASIISEKHLLSGKLPDKCDVVKNFTLKNLILAAQCVHPKQRDAKDASTIYVKIKYENEMGTIDRDIKQIKTHPDWNSLTSYDADVAILVLKSALTFNDFIKPVCIPDSSAIDFNIKGFVAGFINGDVKKLNHVKISSVDIGACVFEDKSIAWLGSRNMFCVGEEGKNAKNG